MDFEIITFMNPESLYLMVFKYNNSYILLKESDLVFKFNLNMFSIHIVHQPNEHVFVVKETYCQCLKKRRDIFLDVAGSLFTFCIARSYLQNITPGWHHKYVG